MGILVAMLAGMVFTRTILKPDVSSAFVLELPPYRQPALKSVLIPSIAKQMEEDKELEKKLEKDPHNVQLLDWLAFMYYSNNELEKARGAYERLVAVTEASLQQAAQAGRHSGALTASSASPWARARGPALVVVRSGRRPTQRPRRG